MAEITELEKDILFIRRDWLNSNSLLIKGKENILIDTGYISSFPQTLSLLQEAGVNPKEINIVVNTHFHSDHVGANLVIQQLSGAIIAAGGLEANLINAGDRWSNWLDFFGQDAPIYHVSKILDDGQLFRTGHYEFRVISTPGHSPGGISLYCEELEMLVCGDALWYRDLGPVNCVVNGLGALDQARDSLQRLADLKVEQCVPGHGPLISDHQENVGRCLRKIEKFLDDPREAAMHIMTRVLTFQIMIEGGIAGDKMGDYLIEKGWVQRFNELCFHADLQDLMDQVLTRLHKSGAIRVDAGVIKAR